MTVTESTIEGVLAVFERAADADWRTPGRVGNVVVLTPELADDVMITADLHGHRENFERICEIADLEGRPRRHLVLQEVCHGGPHYPGGGCRSHELLEEVARLKATYPDRVHFILSNHELAELTDYPILKGQRMLNLMFRSGLHECYGDAAEQVRQGYLEFLRSCPLAVRLPGGVFICHSAPEALDMEEFDASIFRRELATSDFEERRSLFNMVWGRDYRPENARLFAKMVDAKVLIHGHEPCRDRGYLVPNDVQIILDCCCRPASYAILPTDEELSHGEIVKRIRFL